jgi:hypothetical protein
MVLPAGEAPRHVKVVVTPPSRPIQSKAKKRVIDLLNRRPARMSFGVLDEDGLAKTWLKHSIPLKTIPKRDYKPVIIVNGLKIPQQAKHEPHSSDSTGGAKAVSRANQTASVGGSGKTMS